MRSKTNIWRIWSTFQYNIQIYRFPQNMYREWTKVNQHRSWDNGRCSSNLGHTFFATTPYIFPHILVESQENIGKGQCELKNFRFYIACLLENFTMVDTIRRRLVLCSMNHGEKIWKCESAAFNTLQTTSPM